MVLTVVELQKIQFGVMGKLVALEGVMVGTLKGIG